MLLQEIINKAKDFEMEFLEGLQFNLTPEALERWSSKDYDYFLNGNIELPEETREVLEAWKLFDEISKVCEAVKGSTLLLDRNDEDWEEIIKEKMYYEHNIECGSPLYHYILWDALAEEMKDDYPTVTYKGNTYHVVEI